jgi:hypothetical protein
VDDRCSSLCDPHPPCSITEDGRCDVLVCLRRKLASLAEAGTGYSQQTMDAMVKEREHAAHAKRLAEAAFLQSVALRRELAAMVKERDGLQHALLMERGKTEKADADNQRLRKALDIATAGLIVVERRRDELKAKLAEAQSKLNLAEAEVVSVKHWAERELAEARELLERAEKWRDYYRAKWLGPAACPQPDHPDDAMAAAKATPSPSAEVPK